MLAAINETNDSASQICKSVNVLLAIRWTKQAWEQVSAATIKNCFIHCGAMPTESEEELTDPFSDLDTQESDVANLDELLTPLNSGITATEYLDQEDDLCTCFTLGDTDGSNWREGLRAEAITDCSQAKKSALEDEDNSDSSDEEVECTSIKSLDVHSSDPI
jgi:hypothetical protein